MNLPWANPTLICAARHLRHARQHHHPEPRATEDRHGGGDRQGRGRHPATVPAATAGTKFNGTCVDLSFGPKIALDTILILIHI